MFAFRLPLRRIRQLVGLTLSVWLFALAAGVANACVLSLPGPVVPGSAQTNLRDAAHHGLDVHAQRAVVPLDREQDSGKDTCLKFCDDESSALSKARTYGADVPVALVELGELRGTVAPAEFLGGSLSLQRPLAQGPPLVIRFLRLTL